MLYAPAEKALLHPTYMSGVETGNRNPTINVVGRIAKALDVEPGELFVAPAHWYSGKSSQRHIHQKLTRTRRYLQK